MHIFAVSAAAATYFLIRASRHAYKRTLINSFDQEANCFIDAVASVLIASAVVWQLGMIENSRAGSQYSICLRSAPYFSASSPVVRT